MKNKIAPMLKDAKRKGVEQGLYLMAQICLVALENQVNLREVPVDDGFFKAVEKSKVFYADLASEKVCVHCTHAKMRRDICGIYCKSGRVENGKCAKFEEWKSRKGKK